MTAKKLDSVPRLTALRISNGALAGEKLPERIKLLNWGKNESTKGPIILDDISAASLAVNQRELGFERVAVDYEHNTLVGSPEFERTKEPREVAAFGKPEIVPGDGLYLVGLTWTQSGQANARNFEDLSPAPGLDEEGRVLFVHSVALTRNGSVHDLSFFNANANQKLKDENMNPNDGNPNNPNASANPKILGGENFLLVVDLAPAIGLSASATKAEVLTKLTSLSALPERLKAIEDKLTTADAATAQRERDEIVATAAREGKVIPLSADNIKATPTAALRELVEKLPKGVVPLGASNQPSGDKPVGMEARWDAQFAKKA